MDYAASSRTQWVPNDDVRKPFIQVEQIRYYFVIININTRYLFILPLNIKESMTPGTTVQNLRLVLRALEERFGEDSLIDNIRVDVGPEFGRMGSGVPLGIHSFNQNELSSYLRPLGIKLCMFPSLFTNKNRIIDRAIRTIQDMLGEDNSLFFRPDIVSEAVEIYNKRPHQAFNYEFTPAEVQSHKALEECFICEISVGRRRCTRSRKPQGSSCTDLETSL
jgi:hypothetical protein